MSQNMLSQLSKIFKRDTEFENINYNETAGGGDVSEEDTTSSAETPIFGAHLKKEILTTISTTTIEVVEEVDEKSFAPTHSIQTVEDIADIIAEDSGFPIWTIVAIFILIALIILGISGFFIRRYFQSRNAKDDDIKKGNKEDAI